MPVSSKAAILWAHTVPQHGTGQTAFADMRAAYYSLSDALKIKIEHLSAFHSTEYSQAKDWGHFSNSVGRECVVSGVEFKGYGVHGDAYLRPLVKYHCETGKPALFVGRHAFGVQGMTDEESDELVSQLQAYAVGSPRWVYEHNWTRGE